jgi:hypothetical protein
MDNPTKELLIEAKFPIWIIKEIDSFYESNHIRYLSMTLEERQKLVQVPSNFIFEQYYF